MKTCAVESCDHTGPFVRGWCQRHYKKWTRNGDPEWGWALWTDTLRERFERRIERTDGCWSWRGAHDAKGYGHMCFQKKRLLVHRVAYELFVGPIPEGMVIDHLCANKGCGNPEHLEAVTPVENIRRGYVRMVV